MTTEEEQRGLVVETEDDLFADPLDRLHTRLPASDCGTGSTVRSTNGLARRNLSMVAPASRARNASMYTVTSGSSGIAKRLSPVMRWMIRAVLVLMALTAFALGHEPAMQPVVTLAPITAPVDGSRTAIIIPVAGVTAGQLRPSFNEGRAGHLHHAIDILAPRGTPVFAAVDGPIQKLFTSNAGGLTIYEFDRAGQFVYYYAHLDRYAPSITEGMEVTQGTVIGYVGTTGNAPPDTPHLHFAIERLGPEKLWWRGEAIDPYPVLVGRSD